MTVPRHEFLETPVRGAGDSAGNAGTRHAGKSGAVPYRRKYLESLGQLADNMQKLVFLPYETSGIMGSIDGIKELLQAK
jgi:hypothetical protein